MGFDETAVINFTAQDRCDGCGGQAYMLAVNEQFGELMFCAHHRKRCYDLLLDEGWTCIDDYEGLERLAPQTYAAPI